MPGLRVKDVMNRQPPTVKCGASVNEVVDTLLEHGVPGMPVVDDNKMVLGFVSEQDCIHSLLISSYHQEGSPRVNEVMQNEPVTVSPDDSVVNLAEQMDKQRPKIYPVVEEGKLVGLITRSIVLQALKGNREHVDLD